MNEKEREVVTSLMTKGFDDCAAEANTSVTGEFNNNVKIKKIINLIFLPYFFINFNNRLIKRWANCL